jgi:nucleoside-diphosphate-sugar epimerase
MAGVDTVFHLAGRVHAVAESPGEEAEYLRVNTEGTRELLAAARADKVRRFVFFSSVKVFGTAVLNSPPTGVHETVVPAPDTPYGASKLAAEKLVLAAGSVLEPVILRLSLVYGPGVKGNMQAMIEAVRRHRFPPLPETGNRRSLVHVEDVLQAALLAATLPQAVGRHYIVSDGELYSTRRIYAGICAALKMPVPSWSVPLAWLHLAARLGDAIEAVRGRRFPFDSKALEKLIGSEYYTNARICSELGFKPLWKLEQGLLEIVKLIATQARC